MYTKVKELTLSIINTMEPGTLFTTQELCGLVYDSYQGSDIDTQCNTLPQSKLHHGVRWGQQTLKHQGVVSSLSQRGYWVKN